MPIVEYKKTYKDINPSLMVNPMTGDIGLLKTYNAVAFSIKNLVLTMNGERPFNRSIGTPVRKLLFDLHGPMLSIVLKRVIADCLELHEPRAKIIEINVVDDPDSHYLKLDIKYQVLGDDTPYSVDVVLERTR